MFDNWWALLQGVWTTGALTLVTLMTAAIALYLVGTVLAALAGACVGLVRRFRTEPDEPSEDDGPSHLHTERPSSTYEYLYGSDFETPEDE